MVLIYKAPFFHLLRTFLHTFQGKSTLDFKKVKRCLKVQKGEAFYRSLKKGAKKVHLFNNVLSGIELLPSVCQYTPLPTR